MMASQFRHSNGLLVCGSDTASGKQVLVPLVLLCVPQFYRRVRTPAGLPIADHGLLTGGLVYFWIYISKQKLYVYTPHCSK